MTSGILLEYSCRRHLKRAFHSRFPPKCNFHGYKMMHLPRRMTLQSHQIPCLARKMILNLECPFLLWSFRSFPSFCFPYFSHLYFFFLLCWCSISLHRKWAWRLLGPLVMLWWQVIFGDLHGQLFNLFGHLLRVRKQLKAELKAKDTSWFKARPVTTSIPFAGFCRAWQGMEKMEILPHYSTRAHLSSAKFPLSGQSFCMHLIPVEVWPCRTCHWKSTWPLMSRTTKDKHTHRVGYTDQSNTDAH